MIERAKKSRRYSGREKFRRLQTVELREGGGGAVGFNGISESVGMEGDFSLLARPVHHQNQDAALGKRIGK